MRIIAKAFDFHPRNISGFNNLTFSARESKDWGGPFCNDISSSLSATIFCSVNL